MRGPALVAPDPDEPEGAETFLGASFAQGQEAMRRMDLKPDAYVRWPLPDLDALLGPMPPGTVHYVLAFSGTGKSTLMSTAVDAWTQAHVPTWIAPTEITPDLWRVTWACYQLGLDPAPVLMGELRARALAGDLEAARLRGELQTMIAELSVPPWSGRLFVSEVPALNRHNVREALSEAADFGAKLVVFDHVDMLQEDANAIRTANEVQDALLQGAKDHGLVVVATSQCNQTMVQGPNHLLRYGKPREAHVRWGGKKRDNCTTMIGLFRPLRGRLPHEAITKDGGRTVDPYVEAVKLAQRGVTEPSTVLMPGVTGVVCMKHRLDGKREGQCAYLGYHHGRNVPLSDIQRRDLEQMQHAIRTTGGGL